eukprot:8933810-Lingulodinium_polyedra.AAC.1
MGQGAARPMGAPLRADAAHPHGRPPCLSGPRWGLALGLAAPLTAASTLGGALGACICCGRAATRPLAGARAYALLVDGLRVGAGVVLQPARDHAVAWGPEPHNALNGLRVSRQLVFARRRQLPQQALQHVVVLQAPRERLRALLLELLQAHVGRDR